MSTLFIEFSSIFSFFYMCIIINIYIIIFLFWITWRAFKKKENSEKLEQLRERKYELLKERNEQRIVVFNPFFCYFPFSYAVTFTLFWLNRQPHLTQKIYTVHIFFYYFYTF